MLFILINVEDRVWFLKIKYRISNFTAMLNIYFDIYVVALLSRRRGGQLLYIVPYTVSH